jgi:hypothetical protein
MDHDSFDISLLVLSWPPPKERKLRTKVKLREKEKETMTQARIEPATSPYRQAEI